MVKILFYLLEKERLKKAYTKLGSCKKINSQLFKWIHLANANAPEISSSLPVIL